MRSFSLMVLAATLAGVPTAHSAELDVKEGLYELTIQTAMPGMPMPPQTMRDCVTPADKKDPQRLMKQGGGDDCAMQNIKQETNKLSFTLSCPKEQMTGQGNYQFSGTTYTGSMKMSMPNPQGGGQPMTMTVNTSAKLVGPCK